VALALTVLLVVPLIWRRRYPLAVLAVMTVVLALFYGVGLPESYWANIAWALALYGAGAHGGERWRSPVRMAAIAVLASLVAIKLMWPDVSGYAGSHVQLAAVGLLSSGVTLAAAWWLGDAVRVSRERTAELAERTLQLEREREANARRAVLDERVRIARELHDVVAHHVSLMGVQAGAARRVMARQPATAEAALSAIETASRQAVREMHQLLGFLRQEHEADTPAPQPTMRQLDSLVAQMRLAGLPVALTVEGEQRPLPPSVDLSGYRIVQEALTNTLKHAGRAEATVTVRYGDRALEIDVSDDGQRAPADGAAAGGNGLIGLRERVNLLGGRLQVGARPGGGFAVRALIPLPGQPT
jgi:signal transduction histidine kinase